MMDTIINELYPLFFTIEGQSYLFAFGVFGLCAYMIRRENIRHRKKNLENREDQEQK